MLRYVLGRTKNNDSPKQVIFSDGIRPGGDLTELDVSFEPKLPLRRSTRITKCVGTPPGKYTALYSFLEFSTIYL